MRLTVEGVSGDLGAANSASGVTMPESIRNRLADEVLVWIEHRLFIGLQSAASLPPNGLAFSQEAPIRPIKRIRTSTLEIAYEESGPQGGFPVLLMHGFPYDPRAYDEVVTPLVAAGYRTI